MSEPQSPAEVPADQPLDPTKEAMRRALEAKAAAQRQGADGVNRKKSVGGPHGQEGGRRQFRRKAGG